MRSMLRDNLTIVLSVTLPIVVMALFAAATLVPRMFVDPPQHDVIFTRDSNGARTTTLPFMIDLYVSDGRLRARAREIENDYVRGSIPRVFVYSAMLESTREVSLDLPADLDSVDDGDELALPAEIAQSRLSTNVTAPDGWEFDSSRYRGGGLFRDLFGGGSHPNEIRLHKDGATVHVPVPGDASAYYQDVRLLGWVIE